MNALVVATESCCSEIVYDNVKSLKKLIFFAGTVYGWSSSLLARTS
jgi:hypothetical protein